MSVVELTSDDVVEAFCKMLDKGARKDCLPREDTNRYGIDVLYSKSDAAKIMFHFITLDYLEVNLELDLMEFQKRGKEYMEHLYGLLCDQSEQARQQRQEANTITIHTGSHTDKKKNGKEVTGEPPKLKETVAAHNEVFH